MIRAMRVAPLALRAGCLTALAGSAAFSTSAPAPKNIKLYYFDFAFWRAETIRLALFVGGVPFDDVRDVKNAELKEQGKLTFGSVPVLEVDGRILSQTQAMASYAGKLAGMHPDDPWLEAKVDECINGCTDVTMTVGGTFRLPEEEKMAARAAMVQPDGRLLVQLGGLEKICKENGSNGYAVGDSITVADLAICGVAKWLSSGVLDGIPADIVQTKFPAIAKVKSTVLSHPKVQEWAAAHPKDYGKK